MFLLLDFPESLAFQLSEYYPRTSVLGTEQFDIYHLNVNRVAPGLCKPPTLD